MTTEVRVPTLGESVTEATIANWFKQPGEAVDVDEMLCELETDKVTVEVPSPAAGVLAEIVAEAGATVGVNALLATVDEGAKSDGKSKPAKADAAKPAKAEEAEKPARAEEAEKPAKTAEKPAEKSAPAGSRAQRSDVENAPSANKLMAENNLSADQVSGSGRDGRVMKGDVLAALTSGVTAKPSAPAQARAPSPDADAEREKRVRMTRLRQTIAKRLKDAQNTAAMLTTYNEVDMSAVMALRSEYKDAFQKKHGVKLGFMSFFVKACVNALRDVPEVNAEIDGTDVVYKNYYHVGVAVGAPQGLVVPVLRDAQNMSFADIENTIGDLGARARDGQLSMADLQGGTFTISNGGVYGSLMSSPILNPPQSGILGMHKIQERPVVVDGQIVIRPMMYLALSYDHRVVDGQGAVTFLVRVKEAIEDPRRLLMDL